MRCEHCDSRLLRSADGARLLCAICWVERPAGTPSLFAEWGEGGRLDAERWVTALLMGWTWEGLILGGLNGNCLGNWNELAY